MSLDTEGSTAPEAPTQLDEAVQNPEFSGRLERQVAAALTPGFGIALQSLLVTLLVQQNPELRLVLTKFFNDWREGTVRTATDRSRAVAFNPELADKLSDEVKRDLALKYVTAHTRVADAVVQRYMDLLDQVEA